MFRRIFTVLSFTMMSTALVQAQWQPCTPGASVCQNGGNVGIGTTNPSQPLDVNGNIVAKSFGMGGPAPSGYQFFATSSTHAISSGLQLRSMTVAAPSAFTFPQFGRHLSTLRIYFERKRAWENDMGRVIAIIFIFGCTTIAWIILGATIEKRTFAADAGHRPRVASSWGSPQQQTPPWAYSELVVTKVVREVVNGQNIARTVEETITTPLPLEHSRIRVGLDLEQRKKGLLWFPTYRVAFGGDYVFRNTTASDNVTLKLTFPAADAIYDDLTFIIDGRPVRTNAINGVVAAPVRVPVGGVVRLVTGYRSQGLSTWMYCFGEGVSQVRDFQLDMQTDFDAIDFPAGTLSPTTKSATKGGWKLAWRYNNLVTGSRIGMEMPEKIQPGPLAGRISYFAPVSLLFFFFLMFIITTLRRIDLHPMHYFFLAASFFSFHLLLAYLVDHISIHAALVIASVVSLFLVVSYLRIAIGPRFAFVEAGLTQLVYLVGFSYAFFLEGFTGLAITIGAIVTLFVVMQLTARIDWRSPKEEVAELAL